MNTSERLALSIPEAARVSGICRGSLYKSINDGRLTVRRFGKRTLILREDLESFLRALPTGIDAEVSRELRRRKAKAA